MGGKDGKVVMVVLFVINHQANDNYRQCMLSVCEIKQKENGGRG